jgi:Ca2+-binding EF-hand superfamily protein
MKPILTFSALALLALGLSVSTVEAKGKNNSGGAKKPNAVDAYLKQHDHNKNGTIEPTEFQGSKTEFDKWDKNSDGKLDRSELGAMLGKK